jgi:transposase
VSKRFQTCDLDQPYLLPPSLQEWLPEGHLARCVADVMNELDLACIYGDYQRQDGRGLSAYHALLLTRVLLYGYCLGITSSRRIERATLDEVAFRYLAAHQHPDHDTIANFRQRHWEALAGLFVQALRLCQKAGLVKLGNVAIDGTKILANASTRRPVGYAKLTEREPSWKETVEPVFGQIKESRNIRRFRLRTLKKASCEWKLIGATHNLLKLFRHRTAQRPKKGAGSGIVGAIRRPRTESDRRSAFPNTSTLSHSHRNRRASGQRRRFYSDRLLNCPLSLPARTPLRTEPLEVCGTDPSFAGWPRFSFY